MPSESSSTPQSSEKGASQAAVEGSQHSHRLARLSPFFPHLSEKGISWSTDPLVLSAYSQDQWPRKLLELREAGPAQPTVEGVIWPETAEQVSVVMKWASEADVTLYPYGAGSGVCGAILPAESDLRPRIMVDLKAMRKVRSIDRKSMTVWAEAGLIGENLERHLNQEGLTLGHFPSSIYCSSLGGYLATRSAGQLSTKYGKIEDMVLSLEFVLPDGTIAETGRAPRSAMGPDWTQFLMGTEGTLGFFTSACLQVHRIPEARMMMGFGAPNITSAIEFARQVMQFGLRPAVLRIYDPLETSLTLNSEILKKCGFAGGAAIILIFEGRKRIVEAEVAEAEALATQGGLQNLGPSLGEHWWEHRYDVSYKQQLILSHGRMVLDTFELATTWDKIEKVYRAVKDVKVGLGIVLAHLSHFYHTGANIYFTLISHAGFKGSSAEHYDEIWNKMLRAALDAGATLSHHHGVGALKNEWMKKEKGAWVPLFKKVKNGFDPENRLNPSKMGL
jgi:alkyldihydroxyacetonephosphate synthase